MTVPHAFIPADPGEVYEVNGVTLPVAGYDVIDGRVMPRLAVRMMSDEDWNRRALANAHENYEKVYGHPAATDEEARECNRQLAEGKITIPKR